MPSRDAQFKLRKPLVVYALSICFLLAPLGNVIASMISYGVQPWYLPGVFLGFVEKIAWLDRVWLLATFMAGIALLHQRKWSWAFAIGALTVTSFFNFYYTFHLAGHLSNRAHFLPVAFILSNFSVVVVLFHFRFPYLDRRDAWWGADPRYFCDTSVSSNGLNGRLVNISRSGAFVWHSQGELEVGRTLFLRFGPFSDLKARVIRNTDVGCGLKFYPTFSQARLIRQFVRGLAAVPMAGDMPLSYKAESVTAAGRGQSA